jgi:5-methylcytosine-specific restriction endonuclease McrA
MPIKDTEEYNEYMRTYMLNRYHERRAEAFRKLGGSCVLCGATSDLEVDHREWREKSFSIAKLWSVSRKRFEEELKKCQLLCKDCHAAKTRMDLREIRREKGWANQYGSGAMPL